MPAVGREWPACETNPPVTLLFLDIDGVLHPVDRAGGVFSCKPLFEETMQEFPHIEIVVSSSWRIDHTLDQLRGFFSPDIGQRIIGVTPDFNIPGFDLDYRYLRQKEIEAWLKSNGRQDARWIALDDTDWMFRSDCEHLLLVDGKVGFASVEAALRDKIKATMG